MTSSASLNPLARTGFANAAAYDIHRPSFPSQSVQALLDNVRVADQPGATVVDLAAGTGKFTELLAKRPEQYKITAVEPHPDMRKVLQDKDLKDVNVKDGLSTSIPFPNESVDAVIAAQVGQYISSPLLLYKIHLSNLHILAGSAIGTRQHVEVTQG